MMGRKPTVNLNMPPLMHPRKQRSGKVYYYMFTKDKPRKEIPLGDDYILALQKYAALNVVAAPTVNVLFGDVILKYQSDELPKLAKNTIRIQKSDIKHVQAYFKDAPLDQIKPMHIRQFLEKHKEKATTANRCKRLFSTMWNHARGWGYTDLANPCEGIKGHTLAKRTVYITDEVFKAVHEHGSLPLKDALDLAYLTGQRPGDTLKTTEHDIEDGCLLVEQNKLKGNGKGKKLRIEITGELAALLERIKKRKSGYKIHHTALLVNTQGKQLTEAVLRNNFEEAREAAAKAYPDLADEIRAMWFYDLRAKAADDTSASRGDQEASDLLGHENLSTTRRHYLRRGKIVAPTK